MVRFALRDTCEMRGHEFVRRGARAGVAVASIHRLASLHHAPGEFLPALFTAYGRNERLQCAQEIRSPRLKFQRRCRHAREACIARAIPTLAESGRFSQQCSRGYAETAAPEPTPRSGSRSASGGASLRGEMPRSRPTRLRRNGAEGRSPRGAEPRAASDKPRSERFSGLRRWHFGAERCGAGGAAKPLSEGGSRAAPTPRPHPSTPTARRRPSSSGRT